MAAHCNSSFPAILPALLLLFASTLALTLCQATIPHPPPPDQKKGTGTAAFTASPISDSSCFGRRHFAGSMFTGVNDVLYRNGSACGLQYKVTCVGAAVKGQHNPCRRRNNTVTVTVTDSCTPEPDAPGRKPEPCPTFVLSKPTFRSIAALSAGVVSVSYELVNL